MVEKTPTQRLWQDALTGKISRRDVLIRGAALGISAPVLAALAQETIRGTLAAEEGKPVATFYDWELNLHPGIYAVGDAQGVAVEAEPGDPLALEARAQPPESGRVLVDDGDVVPASFECSSQRDAHAAATHDHEVHAADATPCGVRGHPA